MKNVIIALAALALITGGLLSIFASPYPDGLEWAIEHTAGTTELESNGAIFESASTIQETTALMPDYDFKSAGEDGSSVGTAIAGIVGGALTFTLAGGVALTISAAKKRKRDAGTT